ncbi:hypothetical protein LOAG_18314 [Loa loa]|uniref:Cell wall hydrolase/autolysin n=1 Tax=Loa loa TaxID=7209 RepID=A0A1I7VFX7_LOALO|nr:hypothetical protein LOAG_18314 [Loa loa]EJD74366.1 hypothetical protein LOAG_18314 [Loa loa]
MFPCDLYLYAKFWDEFGHGAVDVDGLTTTDSLLKGGYQDVPCLQYGENIDVDAAISFVT